MSEIKITYVDDSIDLTLSKFLETKFGGNYSEYEFDCNNGYEDLLKSEQISGANIVIIDSKLFEDSHVHDKKFTGEEFKIILRKIFPFVEVIVITQNEELIEEQIVRKYKKQQDGPKASDYYESALIPCIKHSIENLNAYRKIADKLQRNTDIDKMLVEKIINSLNGIDEYDELKSEEVDKLIKAFEELQKSINE